MKIHVTVKPRSKQGSVEKIDETHYRVRVKEPAREGRANEGVIEVLSDYFDVPKSQISILSGHSSKNKVVQI